MHGVPAPTLREMAHLCSHLFSFYFFIMISEWTLNEIAIKLEQVVLQQKQASVQFGLQNALLARVISTKDRPTETPATIGEKAVESLAGTGRDVQYSAVGGLSSVLSDSEAVLVADITTEHSLVNQLTPHLVKLFPDRCVINSEEHAWLETTGAPQKPDLFLATPGVYTKKESSRLPLSNLRYGVLSDSRLRDSVYIWDCKVTLTHVALGELLTHLEFLALGIESDKSIRGMLFGKKHFWLIEVRNKILLQRITSEWTVPGTAQLLQTFFPKLPWQKITSLCNELTVDMMDPQSFPSRDFAFMGAGGTARVFCVLPASNDGKAKSQSGRRVKDLLALKVVVTETSECAMMAEHKFLLNHKAACECLLLARPESTEVKSVEGLSGYTMLPVGLTSVIRKNIEDSTVAVSDVFTALLNLHTHPPPFGPIFHGDARLPNLIKSQTGSLFWVDVMGAKSGNFPESASRAFVAADATTLAKSFFAQSDPRSSLLPADILRAINNYVLNQNATTVAAIVSSLLGAKEILPSDMVLLNNVSY